MNLRKIYKYSFPIHRGAFEIAMPVDILFLDVQVQDNVFVLWGIVSASATRQVKLEVYFTGETIPYTNNFEHLKTIQTGGLVYHIFCNANNIV